MRIEKNARVIVSNIINSIDDSVKIVFDPFNKSVFDGARVTSLSKVCLMNSECYSNG